MTPLEALLEIIRSERITRIFGNPGTTELPLLDALSGADDLTYTLGLHEGAVVSMADGYARATRRPALVNLHAAAGVANGVIGMLNARRSRTPIVVTAGQQDRRHLAQDPMLSGDLVGLAAPAVKHAVEVQHGYDLPLVMRRAFNLAVQPPPGPVFVSIPMDVLTEDIQVAVPRRSAVSRLGPAAAGAIGQAADLLAHAERPVLVAGDGVGRERAMPELVQIAELLGATIYQQPMYDGVNVPSGHRLYAGMLPPRHAAIRERLAGFDTLLLVGCRAFTAHHYTPGPAVPDGMRVVQLDSDSAEIGRNFGADLGLVGELSATLRLLAERIAGPVTGAGARAQAAALANEERRRRLDRRALEAYEGTPVDPLAAAHAIACGLPEEAVVVEEAITVGLHLREVLRQSRPGAYLHTVGGGLGWGIGAGIGAQLGEPGRPVVSVLGDGCAVFGLQGLWSAVRHQVPVAFVVLNNGEYHTLKDTLDEHRGARDRTGGYPGLDLGPPELAWPNVARFFGLQAIQVDRADELREVIATVTGKGPVLVEVRIARHRRGSNGCATGGSR